MTDPFETTQLRLAADLRLLSTASTQRALQFYDQIGRSLEAQALVNSSHDLMMRRAAAVAHMAGRAALAVERCTGHKLLAAVEDVLRVIDADARQSRDASAEVAFARTRVELAARQSLDASVEAAFAAASGHED